MGTKLKFNKMQIIIIVDGAMLMIVAWIAQQFIRDMPPLAGAVMAGMLALVILYLGLSLPVIWRYGMVLFRAGIPNYFFVKRCNVCSGSGYRVKIENPSSLKYRSYVNRPCEHCKARGWNLRWTL